MTTPEQRSEWKRLAEGQQRHRLTRHDEPEPMYEEVLALLAERESLVALLRDARDAFQRFSEFGLRYGAPEAWRLSAEPTLPLPGPSPEWILKVAAVLKEEP